MSDDSSKPAEASHAPHGGSAVKTGAILQTIGLGLSLYLIPPIIASIVLIVVLEGIGGWSGARTEHWLQTAALAQFLYILITEALVFAAVIWLVKWLKETWRSIGVGRPKFAHIAYTLGGFAAYYAIYITVAVVIGTFVHLNYDQKQQIGFDTTNISAIGKVLAFISLVVLPPLAEETVFRGLLYSRLKRTLSKIWAGIVVSLLFASAHLQFGSGNALLWTAALDTFVLSCVLVYVREKTGTIWAGVGIHALKNFVAFAILFGIISVSV